MDIALVVGLFVVGFIAAVAFGSVAWYNSKRPPGWENAEKPDIVPDLKPDEKRWPNDADPKSPESVVRK
ncbi:MAG: hypothetical protein H7Y22_13555 [Gemmatimonadaceae bacterium]|nr:hypothetical protein [Gloeobacterales cyanobacterium ES-bin-141]